MRCIYCKTVVLFGMKNNEKTKFQTALDKLMKERNLSQLALSGILGIRQSQISNWINGKSTPVYGSLVRLCERLNVSVTIFFDEKYW